MSVRKRTWTTKGVEKSAWVVDYSDQHGKRRQKSFARKKEADAWAARAKTEVGDGLHVADSATVTIETAAKAWLQAVRRAGLEVGTVDQYERHSRLHIVPYLGARRLTEMTVPVVRAWQDQLRDAGRSSTTVRLATGSLGRILADAQDRGQVVRNAVREMARRPSSSARVEKRQKARLRYGVDIPSTDEIKAIVGAAAGRHRAIILTAAFAGLRASELFGLSWADIELDQARLHVRQRADRDRNIGPPKSSAGRRTIPLPPMVVTALRDWQPKCPKGDLDLAFPTTTGKVQGYHNFVRDGFAPTLIAAGVVKASGRQDSDGKAIVAPKYGMHAMRHWFASWCCNRRSDGGLELPPKAVQERLGHSTITLTMDVYGHLFPVQDEAEALAAAERAFLVDAT
ncbi:phage integrase family protein [Stappia sp. 22II-S9-Z10]|nr:phage integrase family protein [Stappia sp. 22II-S9-Z10]